MIVTCMGGWCHVRDRCAHHYSDSHIIAERLCPKGESQPVEIRPLVRDEEVPPPLRNGALEVF